MFTSTTGPPCAHGQARAAVPSSTLPQPPAARNRRDRTLYSRCSSGGRLRMPSTMRFSSNTVLDSLASVKMVVLWRRIMRNTSWGRRTGVSAEPGPPRTAHRPRRPRPRPRPRPSAPPPAPAHHLGGCLSPSTRRRGRAPPRSRQPARWPQRAPRPAAPPHGRHFK